MDVIGIDFGTKFSSVSVRNQLGEFEVISDDQGKFRVPSCVSFHEDEIRIGNFAELKREINLENTIYDIKMLIGINLKKGKELKSKYNWPFDLTKDEHGRMQVRVNYLKSVHQFYPEEIVSMLFRHLIEIAENKLEPRKVCAAVISVSTAFNHSQRRAIYDAAEIANFKVKAFLNDTTAAAVHYAYMNRIRKNESCEESGGERIMVINIGAGTLSVSICNIHYNASGKVDNSDGKSSIVDSLKSGEMMWGGERGQSINNRFYVDVISSYGESSVGGEDVNIEISSSLNLDYQSKVDFRKSLDRAKKDLSSSKKSHATIRICSIDGKMEREENLERKTFKAACGFLKSRLETAINSTWNGHDEITKVLLAGGSTRLPFVSESLEARSLHDKIEKRHVRTDEIVALGACVIANELSKKRNLKDMISEILSYGIYDDRQGILVSKDGRLPANRKCEAGIIRRIQSKNTSGCYLHSEGVLLSPEALPGRVEQVQQGGNVAKIVQRICDEDRNGMLSVEKNSFFEYSVRTDQNGLKAIFGKEVDGLPEDIIKALIEKQRQFHKIEIERKLTEKVRHDYEGGVLHIKKECEVHENWLEDNQNSTLSEVQQKKQEFETFLRHTCDNPTVKNITANDVGNAQWRDSKEQLERQSLRIQQLQQAARDASTKRQELASEIERKNVSIQDLEAKITVLRNSVLELTERNDKVNVEVRHVMTITEEEAYEEQQISEREIADKESTSIDWKQTKDEAYGEQQTSESEIADRDAPVKDLTMFAGPQGRKGKAKGKGKKAKAKAKAKRSNATCGRPESPTRQSSDEDTDRRSTKMKTNGKSGSSNPHGTAGSKPKKRGKCLP